MVPRVLRGRYELLREIGRGGMGTVFAGRDVVADRVCAIKVLHEDAVYRPEARERFEREAGAPGRIGHPGLVEVYDSFVEDGQMVMVMELLEGKSLRDLMDEGALLREKLAVILGALDPLVSVHAAGFVHRDLKPSNIFITERDGGRRVKLLDFGVARDLASGTLTETGVIVGSTHYISPEQVHSARNVEPTADVFSMSVILYEAASRRLPFGTDNTLRTLTNLAAAKYPPLGELMPALPAELVDLVHECLAFEPTARPRDAAALRARLAPIVERGLSPLGRPTGPAGLRAQRSSEPPPGRAGQPVRAASGRHAKGTSLLPLVKILKTSMRAGLRLDLEDEDRAWLDQRLLLSEGYPLERHEWVIGLIHEYMMGGTEGSAVRMGRLAAQTNLSGVHSTFVYPGDIGRTLRRLGNMWTRYYDFGELSVEWSGVDQVTVTVRGYEDMPRAQELLLVGWMLQLVEMAGGEVSDHDLFRAPSRGDADWVLRLHYAAP